MLWYCRGVPTRHSCCIVTQEDYPPNVKPVRFMNENRRSG
jgi:hypothetical protein